MNFHCHNPLKKIQQDFKWLYLKLKDDYHSTLQLTVVHQRFIGLSVP